MNGLEIYINIAANVDKRTLNLCSLLANWSFTKIFSNKQQWGWFKDIQLVLKPVFLTTLLNSTTCYFNDLASDFKNSQFSHRLTSIKNCVDTEIILLYRFYKALCLFFNMYCVTQTLLLQQSQWRCERKPYRLHSRHWLYYSVTGDGSCYSPGISCECIHSSSIQRSDQHR